MIEAPSESAHAKELSEAIDRTLRDRAHKSERALAVLRAAMLTFAATVNLFQRNASLQLTIAISSGAVIAIAIAYFLNRRYHQSLAFVLPFFDAMVFTTLLINARTVLGVETWVSTGGYGILVGTSMVLTVSGVFRLRLSAMVVCAGSAITMFLIGAATVPSIGRSPMGVALSMLIMVAGCCFYFTAIARRSVRAETAEVTLRRFLPQQVIDGANDDHLGLVEQPRQAVGTVLVTDVRGFTAWSQNRTPQQVLKFLNVLQGAFARAVRSNGGVVDKFLGDGMLAVFGALEEQHDHADRAARAALAITGELEEINRKRKSNSEDTIRAGVGIHSGPLVAGCLGSADRLEFTILGDTVNTATRIESLTKEKGVMTLISEDSVRWLQDHYNLSEVGAVTIRGREAPLGISVLAGTPE